MTGRTGSAVPPKTVIPPAPSSPADIEALSPLTTTWPAGEPFRHCYDIGWGSRQFYAGDDLHRGRFHSFTPAGGVADLGVLYGANDDIGALSETVFHDVPVRGDKHVPRSKLNHRVMVQLSPKRDLTLIDLTSEGLLRLELSRPEMIESDARSYPDTAQWARALHDHPVVADGLLWVSRQHDLSRCLVLFADRVAVSELEVPPAAIPLTLGAGAGLDLVCAAADRAGITITGLTA